MFSVNIGIEHDILWHIKARTGVCVARFGWCQRQTHTQKIRSLVGKMGKDKTIIVTNNWIDIKDNNGGI